jgi:hypothetical protein
MRSGSFSIPTSARSRPSTFVLWRLEWPLIAPAELEETG